MKRNPYSWKENATWFELGTVAVGLIVLLAGCGEAASCWNDIKGRFTSCEDMRRDEIDKRIGERKSPYPPMAKCWNTQKCDACEWTVECE